MEEESKCELRMKLPGFRFHPTEEELLNFYLKAIVFGHKLRGDVIGFLNIYNYDPNDLPKLAKTGEREWYFFVPRDRKHGGGGRPNRTTEKGFWKATGSDRQIPSTSDPKKILGLKKTLVFYQGRAPRGTKTNWIMNEYRLPHNHKSPAPQEIVLCKIYMKATSLKVLEQRATTDASSSLSPPMDASLSSASLCSMQFEEEEGSNSTMIMTKGLKREREEENHDQILVVEEERQRRGGCLSSISSSSSSLVLPNGLQNLAELQVPKLSMDWTQDSFWTQLSPWIDNFTPFLPLC